MAAYSNYQMPQYGQQPPPPPGQPGYGQQPPPPGQYGVPPPQQQNMGGHDQFSPYASYASSAAPSGRMPLRRSLSMGSAQEIKNQMAMVSFDPYASQQNGAPGAPGYNNYSLPPQQQQPQQPHEIDNFLGSTQALPPTFSTDDMTTTPMTASQFGFAQSAPPAVQQQQQQYNQMQPPPHQQQQQQQQQQFDPTASGMSDITMFSSTSPTASATAAATTTETALVPAPQTAVVPKNDPKDDAVLANIDPKVLAEQEKIYADIQARNKMQQIRKNAGLSNGTSRAMVPSSRAMVPHQAGYPGQRPGAPVRTRSMPHPNNRGQENSLARGGVAVLDPKKDMRKQTRKMKTAGGAVGGAVVGGLILGPVGVVLGAGGGAAVSNKMAKSRDKRKQQEYEQRNFQKGAASSVAAKGDGSFV